MIHFTPSIEPMFSSLSVCCFPQSGSTPLFMASQNGHTDVVKILLANGADVNLTGFQVIMDGKIITGH